MSITQLDNSNIQSVEQIRSIFQASYAVEAELLKAVDFPPLKRPLDDFKASQNLFFGYYEGQELAAVVEIDEENGATHIQSLVVHPDYFRKGIARKILTFVFYHFDSKMFTVETGIDNKPAIALYEQFGFREVKQWDTDHGVRKVRFERQGNI